MKARLKILSVVILGMLLLLFILIPVFFIAIILYPIYWVLTGKDSIMMCLDTIEWIADKTEISKL